MIAFSRTGIYKIKVSDCPSLLLCAASIASIGIVVLPYCFVLVLLKAAIFEVDLKSSERH